MCADLSGNQTDRYWAVLFNACCEDAEGQILMSFPAHLSLYFFPYLKTNEILVEAPEASLVMTCQFAC